MLAKFVTSQIMWHCRSRKRENRIFNLNFEMVPQEKSQLNIYHLNQQMLLIKSMPLSKLVKFHFIGTLMCEMEVIKSLFHLALGCLKSTTKGMITNDFWKIFTKHRRMFYGKRKFWEINQRYVSK